MIQIIKISNIDGYSFFDGEGNIIPTKKSIHKIVSLSKLNVQKRHYTDKEFKKHRGFVDLVFPNGKVRTVRTW